MPRARPSPCAEPGCPRLVRDGSRCDEHHRERQREEHYHRKAKGTKGDFYSSRRWRAVRKRYARKHPLCEPCEAAGRTVAVQVVHHVVPRSEGGADFDFDNLASYCHDCHNAEHGGGHG